MSRIVQKKRMRILISGCCNYLFYLLFSKSWFIFSLDNSLTHVILRYSKGKVEWLFTSNTHQLSDFPEYELFSHIKEHSSKLFGCLCSCFLLDLQKAVWVGRYSALGNVWFSFIGHLKLQINDVINLFYYSKTELFNKRKLL